MYTIMKDVRSNKVLILLTIGQAISLALSLIAVRNLIDEASREPHDLQAVTLSFLLLTISIFMQALMNRLRQHEINELVAITERSLHERLVASFKDLPFYFTEKQSEQKDFHYLQLRLPQYNKQYIRYSSALLSSFIQILVYTFTAAWLDAKLILLMIPLTVLVLVGSTLIKKKEWEMDYSGAEHHVLSEYYDHLMNDRAAMKEMRLFANRKVFLKRYLEQYQAYRATKTKAKLYALIKNLAVELISVLFLALSIAFVLYRFSLDLLTLGDVTALIGLLLSFIHVLAFSVPALLLAYQESRSYHQFYAEKLKTLGSLQRKGTSEYADLALSGKELTLQVRDLSFTYPHTDKQVLGDISLELTLGKRYALFGPNGSGKSTFIKLLLSLYDSYSGSIQYNGTDLLHLSRHQIQSLFTVSMQNNEHFSLSLRDYLNLNRTNDPLPDIELHNILKTVQLDRLFQASDITLDDTIGKLASTQLAFSTGEWQFLTLARALCTKDRFTIFDEATSALDPLREELFYKICSLEFEGGYLIIAHRLAVSKYVESILYLEDGQLIEKGTHEELMDLEGRYYHDYVKQSSLYAQN